MNAFDDLVEAARAARERAVAPYSNFKVGAALVTRAGRIYGGCNVENASYGLTVCAERVALLKALSEGEREFRALAVVADTAQPTPQVGPPLLPGPLLLLLIAAAAVALLTVVGAGLFIWRLIVRKGPPGEPPVDLSRLR